MDPAPQPESRAAAEHQWIAESGRLTPFLSASGPVLALDSEFMRVHTYWPELALVQICGAAGTALVDPLAELAPMLASEHVVKVMHSASEDIAVLAHSGARRLARLFDTQIAAAYAGFGHGV